MKRILFLVAVLLSSALSALSSENDSMTFRCKDGTLYSIGADNLTISIASNRLVAGNGTENIDLKADDVVCFFFGTSSGIAVISANKEAEMSVYDLSGKYLGKYSPAESHLAPGVYIVKSGDEAIKMYIR